MKPIIRSFVPLGLVIAFVSTLLWSASASALEPNFQVTILSDDTPECLDVKDYISEVVIENTCTVDVTFTPVEGACTNCTEEFVFPANSTNALWGQCGVSNSFHWSMPGEDPETVDEGILEWQMSCESYGAEQGGCSAAPSANGSSAVLMLTVLGLLVMGRRRSLHRVHSD